jgi:hypothetical protein
VVNGLQTIKSIHNAIAGGKVAISQLDGECWVQVKVIKNAEPDFIERVVATTNNQNRMHPRNLKSQTREQKLLHTLFKEYAFPWFYEIKEGQWASLTDENERFFKAVVQRSPKDFKPDPHKKAARIIDNEQLAKAWLAFVGLADRAADRVTHYFSEDELYQLSFNRRPSSEHWELFAGMEAFDDNVSFRRADTLRVGQASPTEYLLAYALLEFTKAFVPSPKEYRDLALQEGVRKGLIAKADGSFKITPQDEESFLGKSPLYQTWRLLANMKELLVECCSHILARKYGALDEATCNWLLNSTDLKDYTSTGEIKGVAEEAAGASDLASEAVVSRIFGLLRHAGTQFWEEKKDTLLSTSRIRTVLIRRDVVADFKSKIWEVNDRRGLDKAWKPEGKTFLESLPECLVKSKAKGA